ncbi:uncharacterized protein LOC102078479 [Oreochromis niloticus]|uniref:uncharacterized protein LOC102078479 n=1 Tax=Oreochromis niloticus TaxID=8128 RepID=UPI0009048205|nr:uncharacterized protein LOC102078479 [Oreochromis niloticus]XP_025758462.1 uncharacterized protein LOC102078479 [Oreochromis niloticus]
MDPADSRTISQEELLAQLWSYCQSILQGADPPQRHLQVVFFDSFLSSTTLSVSFLDIKRLILIITMLRASSCFELFGLGCPGEEDVATSLGALAAHFFFHRQIASPPSFAAHLLDPPLWGTQVTRPLHLTTSPLTSAASAESADKGPAAQSHTAALLSGRLVEPQPVAPAPASSKKQRSCRRRPSPPPDSLTFPQLIVSQLMAPPLPEPGSAGGFIPVKREFFLPPVPLSHMDPWTYRCSLLSFWCERGVNAW